MEWGQVKFADRQPETAEYECSACGAMWGEGGLREANRGGKYVAEREFRGIASFRLNALANPWKTMEELVREWVDAVEILESRGDISRVRTFVMNRKAEPWSDRRTRLDAEEVYRTCRVRYPKTHAPEGVVAVVMVVDTQDDRLEYELAGFGVQEVGEDDLKSLRALGDGDIERGAAQRLAIRRWGLGYGVIHGDPSCGPDKGVWQELNEIYSRKIELGDDVQILPQLMLVDSGGHQTAAVRDFVAGRGPGGSKENIFPIKGATKREDGIFRKSLSREQWEKFGNDLYLIGTYAAKEVLHRFIGASRHQPAKTRFYSWPTGDVLGYDLGYFQGLCSEQKVMRQTRTGHLVPEYQVADGLRNEPWDLCVYALAGVHILGGIEYLKRRRAQVVELKKSRRKG